MALLGLRVPRDLDALAENLGDKVRRRPIADLTRTPRDIVEQRRTCSAVEYFVQQGRPVYLADYGAVEFKHRNQGSEHRVDSVVSAAIKAASTHADGVDVHVAGWSLGGIFTMFAAAAHRELLYPHG